MRHIKIIIKSDFLSRLFISFFVDIFTNSSTFQSEKAYNYAAKEVFNADLNLSKNI